jgi:hypothetical protein
VLPPHVHVVVATAPDAASEVAPALRAKFPGLPTVVVPPWPAAAAAETILTAALRQHLSAGTTTAVPAGDVAAAARAASAAAAASFRQTFGKVGVPPLYAVVAGQYLAVQYAAGVTVGAELWPAALPALVTRLLARVAALTLAPAFARAALGLLACAVHGLSGAEVVAAAAADPAVQAAATAGPADESPALWWRRLTTLLGPLLACTGDGEDQLCVFRLPFWPGMVSMLVRPLAHQCRVPLCRGPTQVLIRAPGVARYCAAVLSAGRGLIQCPR